MTAKTQRNLNLIAALISVLVAANTAFGMVGRVRAVDVALLFSTGMSAGATLAMGIRKFKEARSA